MKQQYWLSICIAVYNEGKAIYDKIGDLLNKSPDWIQVVVSDNASEDDTVFWLRQIVDERLKLVCNSQNRGPTYNYVNALREGEGRYLMFMTDKDMLQTEYLPAFRELLEESSAKTGFVSLNFEAPENSIRLYKQGRDAVVHVGYLSKHPTGYFYERECFRKIAELERFENVNMVGYFPFEFLCAEIACMGNAAEIKLPLLVTAKLSGRREESKTYSEDGKNLFFNPEKRYDLMLKCMRHLDTLPLKKHEKKAVRRKIYKKYWFLAVAMWAEYKKDALVCEHYRMKREVLSGKEKIAIAERFMCDFNKDTGRGYYAWSKGQILKMKLKESLRTILHG